MRVFAVEDAAHSADIGECHQSQGDGGDKVVISCVLAQQIGLAVKDVEPSIEN